MNPEIVEEYAGLPFVGVAVTSPSFPGVTNFYSARTRPSARFKAFSGAREVGYVVQIHEFHPTYCPEIDDLARLHQGMYLGYTDETGPHGLVARE